MQPPGSPSGEARFLHPGQDLPRPSLVGLTLAPGSVVLGVDDDLTIIAEVARGQPPGVILRSRVPGGEWRRAECSARR